MKNNTKIKLASERKIIIPIVRNSEIYISIRFCGMPRCPRNVNTTTLLDPARLFLFLYTFGRSDRIRSRWTHGYCIDHSYLCFFPLRFILGLYGDTKLGDTKTHKNKYQRSSFVNFKLSPKFGRYDKSLHVASQNSIIFNTIETGRSIKQIIFITNE